MAKTKNWTPEEDQFLIDNFCLTNIELSSALGVSDSTIKRRYLALKINRPAGKNDLTRARVAVYRERLRGKVPDEWYGLPCTRLDARRGNITFYWDGQPCERAGHLSRRKASSGGCWDCDYGDHKEKIKNPKVRANRILGARKRYAANKEEILAKQKEKKNTPESREWYRNYEKIKRKENIEFRLAKSLRDRLYKAIKRESKAASAVDLVGCTLNELKAHLERKFLPDMTWDNYGEWHIDHVRPCISFDLNVLDQQKECFHYTNLSPLWAEDNKSKGGIWGEYDPRSRGRMEEDDNFN